MRLLPFVLLLVAAACRPPGYGRQDHPDAAVDATPGDGTTGTDAPSDAAPACVHDFRLDGHGTATSVWLTGDFVNWAGTPPAGAVALTLGVDGGWTGSHGFAAGTYQYKFIVDGSQWIPDPTNPDSVDDGFGSQNSLYTCAP